MVMEVRSGRAAGWCARCQLRRDSPFHREYCQPLLLEEARSARHCERCLGDGVYRDGDGDLVCLYCGWRRVEGRHPLDIAEVAEEVRELEEGHRRRRPRIRGMEL